MNQPPLNGITVLSLEHAIAAPLCTRQLAEVGARVTKVERRETGDFAEILGHPSLAEDARFAGNAARSQNRGELRELIVQAFAKLDSAALTAGLDAVGGHTESILRELGYSEPEIRELSQNKVI